MASTKTIAPAKSPAESPYKLEPSQVLKASGALLQHLRSSAKEKEASAPKKSLLAAGHEDSEDEEGVNNSSASDAEPVWLIFTTKKHIKDQKALKPKKILMPHSLNVPSAVTSICLITPDPQRSFKDIIAQPSFPKELGAKIRVLGVTKLKQRYKSFEERRRFRDEHDVFLADDRVITMLPMLLGKTLYKTGTKKPVPVRLAKPRPKNEQGKTIKGEKGINSNKRTKNGEDKDASALNPEPFAREIERALSSAQVSLSPSTTTAVRVGFSSFTDQQLADNVRAVVEGMVESVVSKGWRNVRSIHIKGNSSASLPVWLASELWEEDEDVLEDEDASKAKALESQQGRKRKIKEGEERAEEGEGEKQKRLKGKGSLSTEAGFSKEMAERREKLRQQKKEAKKAIGVTA